MKAISSLAALLIVFTPAATAQVSSLPKDTTLSPVEESDVHWNIVQKEIERITKTDPESAVANQMLQAGRIEGKAIGSLFPKWKFYYFSYMNYLKEGFEDHLAHLAYGLGHTIAVVPDSREGRRLNSKEFGDLLREEEVGISNAADAELVWHAFCEIHMHAWKDYGIERVSETEWKLGVTSYDQTTSVVDGVKTIVRFTHYRKVETSPTSNEVTLWENILETSDKRLEEMRHSGC